MGRAFVEREDVVRDEASPPGRHRDGVTVAPALDIIRVVNTVDRLIEVVKEVNAAGTTLLLVGQDVLVGLDVAQRACVLENGQIVLAGTTAAVRDDSKIRKAYLGL
jgi:ABC-type branched-subunit amino acid transport system ATPase component